MIHRKTRWAVAPWSLTDEQQSKQLAAHLKLSPLVAKLLVQRGYGEVEAAERFLRGGQEHFHDPYLLLGMKAAVDRIRLAASNHEKIRIYGDYDADGVSSTALLVHLFRSLNYSFDYYIPHRALEGYGLNKKAIELAAEEGIGLIVTVDTGISAVQEIAYAKELGIDVVVTDHHEPPEQIPAACAVVNPKQEGCGYPFKGLAGVGVAFKLAHALLDRPPLEWADIVSLGTIADLMPLKDENRILVQYGLERLRKHTSIGFRALAEAGGIELDNLTATNVAFGMAPRVNAAGRLEHAKRAVELLTTEDYDNAILAAIGLDSLNKERQRVVESIVKEAEQQWQDKCEEAALAGRLAPPVIVLAGEGWNVGVIGIVASKLLERNYKPVIILGIDEQSGMCKGSARSIEGFDLHAALTACDALLDHYGGHQAAAGMSLHRDRLPEFEQRLGELAAEWLTADDWIPKTSVDLVCTVNEATIDTINELSQLEPFGMGNPSPRLLFRRTELADRRSIGKESKHLKISLGSARPLLDGIGFSMGAMAEQLKPGSKIDIIGELSINEWNGQRKPQLQLHDVHFDPAAAEFPEREHFGKVYQLIKKLSQAPLEGLGSRLSQQTGLSLETVDLMLDIFEELAFIERSNGMMIAASSPQKRDLTASTRYIEAKQQFEALQISVFSLNA
ncbi:single-stranded-DNA-specific exonuclease RecJ [Paenibacillus sp. FSL H8-0548]|uniref:single-stranded-DNA-specific exonuclease RecJ n=1 Tax=Paenibacillus sp. FSL H8-0548 TaxID=1920422 RepID=UPI00096DF728|nr:single-stranded-DNA-specific exonuclease RecJ [Paenibacillus sp. FSL H8-0548]OMF31699.1 single-stranded-DNA-specific exonuclease RecJ [Paenibacillus sp. FSL H8-0548]